MFVYQYGMKSRGCSPGCQPADGFVERKDDVFGEYYDVIVYSRPLSATEITEYELDYIGQRREE